ncbi:MAG: hypothetical protein SGPRY_006314, partial [Prymnesium sp.]
ALEDFLELLQESVVTIQSGQASGHRVGTISLTTPSSVNVPTCQAVSTYVSNRLNTKISQADADGRYLQLSDLPYSTSAPLGWIIISCTRLDVDAASQRIIISLLAANSAEYYVGDRVSLARGSGVYALTPAVNGNDFPIESLADDEIVLTFTTGNGNSNVRYDESHQVMTIPVFNTVAVRKLDVRRIDVQGVDVFDHIQTTNALLQNALWKSEIDAALST